MNKLSSTYLIYTTFFIGILSNISHSIFGINHSNIILFALLSFLFCICIKFPLSKILYLEKWELFIFFMLFLHAGLCSLFFQYSYEHNSRILISCLALLLFYILVNTSKFLTFDNLSINRGMKNYSNVILFFILGGFVFKFLEFIPETSYSIKIFFFFSEPWRLIELIIPVLFFYYLKNKNLKTRFLLICSIMLFGYLIQNLSIFFVLGVIIIFSERLNLKLILLLLLIIFAMFLLAVSNDYFLKRILFLNFENNLTTFHIQQSLVNLKSSLIESYGFGLGFNKTTDMSVIFMNKKFTLDQNFGGFTKILSELGIFGFLFLIGYIKFLFEIRKKYLEELNDLDSITFNSLVYGFLLSFTIFLFRSSSYFSYLNLYVLIAIILYKYSYSNGNNKLQKS